MVNASEIVKLCVIQKTGHIDEYINGQWKLFKSWEVEDNAIIGMLAIHLGKTDYDKMELAKCTSKEMLSNNAKLIAKKILNRKKKEIK